MFCPKCRAEYAQGHKICPDCDVALAPELAADTSEPTEFVEYTEVLTTNNPAEAALIQSMLDAEGIQYFFQGEQMMLHLYPSVPVKLLVRKDQAADALAILKGLDLPVPDDPRESGDFEDA